MSGNMRILQMDLMSFSRNELSREGAASMLDDRSYLLEKKLHVIHYL